MFESDLGGRKPGQEKECVLNMESLHSHCLGELIRFLFLGNTFLHFLELSVGFIIPIAVL